MRFQAVLFDFGGVMTSSPFDLLRSLAADAEGADALQELILGPYHTDSDHPWHQVERGEMALADYGVWVMAEAAERGLELGGGPSLGDMVVQEPMVDVVKRARAAGLRTGLLTNNVVELRDLWRSMLPLDDLFDDVVESCLVGLRKPDPRIYALALERLGGIDPDCAIFLDDHPGNIAGAEAAGLTALLVESDPGPATAALAGLLEWD